jgi:uncharacterized protein YtpQ (UPF0354 family)
MAIGKVISKLAKNKKVQAGATALLFGTGLYGAHKGKQQRDRDDDKIIAKEIRKSAKDDVKKLMKSGKGRWITVNGRRLFLSSDKKYSSSVLNKALKTNSRNLWKQ